MGAVVNRCSMHVPGNVCRDLCFNRITSTGKSGLSTITTLGAGNMHAVTALCQPGDKVTVPIMAAVDSIDAPY